MRKHLNIRFIWKIDAVLILAVGIAACILLLFGAVSTLDNGIGPGRLENVVRTQRDLHEDWTLGRFDAIPGAGYFVAPPRPARPAPSVPWGRSSPRCATTQTNGACRTHDPIYGLRTPPVPLALAE